MTLMVFIALLVLLFAAAYITKRRFGVLGLGLTAGLVLSREVSKEVAQFLQYIDFPVGSLTFPVAASMLLILSPALAMLVAGPKYGDRRLVLVGSLVFALFAGLLLLGPVSISLVRDNVSIQPLLSQIALNSPLLIAAGVTAAVVDTMYAQGKKPIGKKSKH